MSESDTADDESQKPAKLYIIYLCENEDIFIASQANENRHVSFSPERLM